MRSRVHLPAEDRQARSRLMQLLARGEAVLQASLVRMARRCGKPGCRCLRGPKHVSRYLAVRDGRRRVMLYLPPELEEPARRWIANGQSVREWLEQMSQASLKRLKALKAKRS